MNEDDSRDLSGPVCLTPPQLLDLYRAMALTRAAEERLEILFKQGHVSGGFYRSLGQEAGAVGAAYPLRRLENGAGDVLAHTIRGAGALFLFGGTPLEYFRQYLARGTGPTGGRDANVHWTDFRRGFVGPVSPLGTMVGVMAGITLTFRVRGEDRVGMVFYGDGATSTGAWHEGLNFAAVRRCPMVLVVEANQWAFSTPTRKQTLARTFVDRAPGYGIAGESVDGTDVLAVYEAARRAVGRARAGEGVTLLELRSYRRKGHAQHDAQAYVPPEELREWEGRDPILRYRERLLSEGWAGEEELDGLDEEVRRETESASARALEEPYPEGPTALEGVYSNLVLPGPWTRRPTPDPREG